MAQEVQLGCRTLNLTAMKRLNAIQSQNLKFVKFFIIALFFVFLIKVADGIFGNKNNEMSRKTPAPLQSGVPTAWKG